MPHALDGIFAKIERANEHIQQLDLEISAFENSAGHTITGKREGADGLIAVGFDGSRIPLRFNVVIGEVVHQLRSSLDHLIWQLVLKNKEQPSRKHEFPLFIDRTKYRKQSRQQIEGVSASADTRIEASQPYHLTGGPQSHPLWLVHEMDRMDKHRLLPTSIGQVSFDNRFLKRLFTNGETPPPYRLGRGPMGVEINMDEDPSYEITIPGYGKNQAVIPFLQRLSNFTRDTIELFRSTEF